MTDEIEQTFPLGYDRLSDPVTIYWYDHDCEWISKHCDEHHRKSARVARIVLETVTTSI